MAHLWLLPRLPRLGAEHPNIAASILASDRESECLGDGVDLALLHGDGNWPGFDAGLLIRKEILPVCNPEFLASEQGIGRLENLLDRLLLDLKGDLWDWVDWQQWLAEAGVELPETTQTLSFNALPLLIEAARHGQGIGLGWKGEVVRESWTGESSGVFA